MSDSISKYYDLMEEAPRTIAPSEHQRGISIINEIILATQRADLLHELVSKASEISTQAPKLTPVTVFQIAADAVKVDELCNKIN
jgi:hypothetical protein